MVLRLRRSDPTGSLEVSTPVYHWRRLAAEWTLDDTAVVMAVVLLHGAQWQQEGWTAVELVDRFCGDRVLWVSALPVENWRSLEGAIR